MKMKTKVRTIKGVGGLSARMKRSLPRSQFKYCQHNQDLTTSTTLTSLTQKTKARMRQIRTKRRTKFSGVPNKGELMKTAHLALLQLSSSKDFKFNKMEHFHLQDALQAVQSLRVMYDENPSGSEDINFQNSSLPTRNHPFAIPEIVSNLLKFIPGNDLMQCRLVNQLWNFEGTREYLKKYNLVLSYQNRNRLEEFLKLTSSGTFKKFSRLTMNFQNWPISLYAEKLLEIFKYHEDNLAHLSMIQPTNVYSIGIEDLWEVLKNFRKLETLKLSTSVILFNNSLSGPVPTFEVYPMNYLTKLELKFFIFSHSYLYEGTFTKHIFKITPNLVTLTLVPFYIKPWNVIKGDGADAMNLIVDQLCAANLMHLRYLFIHFRVRENTMQKLINQNFELYTLFIYNYKDFLLDLSIDKENRIQSYLQNVKTEEESKVPDLTDVLRSTLHNKKECYLHYRQNSTQKMNCLQFIQAYETTISNF